MILTCNCLNIHLDTKDNPIKFDRRSLGGGYNTHFFTQDLLCTEIVVVTKMQDCLISEVKVKMWIMYECLNCDMLCFAKSIDPNVMTVLISPELLTDQKQIQMLKDSDSFSSVYEIFINWNDGSNQLYSPRPSALLPPKIKALQRQMSEKIENETKLVEEKIRIFTERQYSLLDEFRSKAQNDYHSLAWIISEKDGLPNFNNLPAQTSSNKNVSYTQKLPIPIDTTLKNNPTMNLMDFTFSPYTKGNRNVSSKASLNKIPLVGGSNDSGLPPASYDAEGLFPLEDMDNLQTGCASDEDLSESEGESGSHDEGIYIPRHKRLEMATSLPVDVPRFMVNSGGSVPSDVNPRIPVGRESEDKTDIAASIKALAKSLHGDKRIFGDLPRPRLGSQI